MNNTQRQFVDILSASIRGKNITNIYDNVNWDEILDLAGTHKVEGIIYLGLNKSGLTKYIEAEKLEKLKRSTFNTGIGQLRHIKNLSIVFNKFNKENIPVIVLKGLVVRDFYPRPEQRSMCDADILVHKKDVERAKLLLIEMGYTFLEDHKASHHIALAHPYYPMVEIHWHLFKRDGFSSELSNFEKLIWKDAITVKVGDAEVISLGYEDLVLHLCMHMAAHLAASGFGLRQLCDLVLLVEKMEDDFNWESFFLKAKMYGFEKFSIVMFDLCHYLFKMDLPKGINNMKLNNINNKYRNALITEIFESGVHGNKYMVNSFGNQLAFDFEKKDGNCTFGTVKRFLLFIFPPVNKMTERYNYAKINRLFIPIAWIHHLFTGIFNSEYRIKDKVRFIIVGVGISIKKNRMLNWLEL